MPLKITLKPGERVFIGTATVATTSDQVVVLLVDGQLPVLREKDFLPEHLATSEPRKLYLLIQNAYLAGASNLNAQTFSQIVGKCLSADAGAQSWIAEIDNYVTSGSLYKALKPARHLVQFTEGVVTPGDRSSEWLGFGQFLS
jgi:flagellar protein FlbT